MTRRFTLQFTTRTATARRARPMRAEPVSDRAFLLAMERLRGLPNSVEGRTPEEWAEIDRALMTDDPVNFGDPESTPRRT